MATVDQRVQSLPRGVTRRSVLGAALAGSAGVAAVRLWAPGGILSGGAPTSAGDWRSPLGSEAARVAHLLRRATFGASPAELERAIADGYSRTVDRLLESKPAAPPELAQAATPGGRFPIDVLQRWWISHILSTPTPFAERMTLFWHGHFTSDYRKVANNTFMYWQNLSWRRMGLGDLRSMLLAVTSDPAMLRYLDLATSTGSNPNENYSRELMELFSMGVGSFGESDVRAGARALAGWTLPPPSSYGDSGQAKRLPVYDAQAAGTFNPRRGYSGAVTFLGKTGHLDTPGVIDRILAQGSTAPFIVSRVLQQFAVPSPGSAYVRRLADRFRSSKYDLRGLMRDVFTSPEFVADNSYRSLVKSPLEFMVHAARALGGGESLVKLIAGSGAGMGQALFDPPDVGGWPNNDSWISSNNVLARVNFVSAALKQSASPAPAAAADGHHLDGVLGAPTRQLLGAATSEQKRWFIVLASPEFQLK